MWEVGTDWHVAGTGDFNGDGRTDIMWRNDNGQFNIWQGTSDNDFITSYSTGVAGNDWRVIGTGDFDGSQLSGILWRNDNGQLNEWDATQDGANFVTTFSTTVAGIDWSVVGTGDFNGDGRSDILWREDTGQFNIWQSTADGTNFVTSYFTMVAGTDWHVVATGDFNGDGRDDIVWRNDNGQLNVWQSVADERQFITSYSTMAPTSWHVAGAGDFNGDGKSDILWRSDDGTISNWLGQADGSFLDNSAIASQPVTTDLQVAGVGDFDGDHRADVLWRGIDGSLDIWTGAADGSILSPGEKAWQEALANVSAFFDEMNGAIDQYNPADQGSSPNSYYGGDPDPMAAVYYSMFAWKPVVQSNPTAPLPDLLLHSDDPVLNFLSSTTFGFTAQFGSNFGSMSLLNPSTNEFLLNTNGNLLQGTWHADAPPPGQPSDGIVITGYRNTTTGMVPTGYFSFDVLTNLFALPPGGPTSGGGTGGQGYSTTGVSLAANIFADKHVKNGGTTALDEHAYELAHDGLAKFYDWATANPMASIGIGNGLAIPAIEALLDFQRTVINIADTGGDPYGGSTRITYDQSGSLGQVSVTTINPQLIAAVGYPPGDTSINYQIFHELGHTLNGFEYGWNNAADEAAANTAGRSIENYLSITLMPVPPPAMAMTDRSFDAHQSHHAHTSCDRLDNSHERSGRGSQADSKWCP